MSNLNKSGIFELTTFVLMAFAIYDTAAIIGDATYYNVDAGYTACGTLHGNHEMVAAIGFPYWTSANPNLDPMCQKRAWIRNPATGKQITVSIKDKCASCGANNIDLSPGAFQQFHQLGVGRFRVEWGFQ